MVKIIKTKFGVEKAILSGYDTKRLRSISLASIAVQDLENGHGSDVEIELARDKLRRTIDYWDKLDEKEFY
jgi:hypothetical protein